MVSKLNPIMTGDFLSEDEDNFVQCIMAVFDRDRDGTVHLQDFLLVFSRMFLGSPEEKFLQGFAFFDR